MTSAAVLDAGALRLGDPDGVIDDIAEGLRREVRKARRHGVVVALSGGIDSSVVAALAARALGPERVLAVLMPEADSAADTRALSERVASWLNVRSVLEELTPMLEAVGCYRRRDEAFRRAIPSYGPGWAAKLVLPDVIASDSYALTSVVARDPSGAEHRARLDPEAYRQAVAATSFKQRTRAMLTYYHADREHYLVAGTPNRLEYDLGFFVKSGDGAADVKPIAHLFKTQVYELADLLGVPAEVRDRAPTTDTFALPQRQDEFYFALPYQGMDLCLLALDRGLPASSVHAALGLSEADVERVFADVAAKRRAARYLHAPPQLLGEIPQGESPSGTTP